MSSVLTSDVFTVSIDVSIVLRLDTTFRGRGVKDKS